MHSPLVFNVFDNIAGPIHEVSYLVARRCPVNLVLEVVFNLLS